MNSNDKHIIRGLAAGRQDYRTKAIIVFRDALKRREPIEGPYMLFMSEVDNPVPDLILRARYRAEVIAAPVADATQQNQRYRTPT